MLDNSDNGHRSGPTYLFEPFRLDATEKVLWRGEQPVPLTPKTFDLLIYFVQNNGHLVEKDELLKRVWPDAFVEESTLAHNIYLLRKALGDDSGEVRYIENVPRRGYRFTAAVSEIPSAGQVLDKVQLINEGGPLTNAGGTITAPPPASLFTLNRRWTWKKSALLTTALVLVVAGWRASWSPRTANQANPALPTRRVAVLPFRSLGTEPTDEFRGLGITDAMITKLSKFRSLLVLPTSSISKYANQPQDPVAIGQKLGVDTVLDGTVQSAGDRVRLTVQMIRVSDGTTLWSERFDEKFTDIFTLEDSMSEEVAQAFSIQLTGDEKRYLKKRYTNSSEAYQSYMMGLFFWNKRSKDGLSKAIQYFQQALDKDPNYVLAYAGLADSYFLSVFYHYDILSEKEASEKANTAATKALALDDALTQAHTARAMVQWYFESDKAGAEESLKRAITLEPNYATAHLRYAWLLIDQGRVNEAIQEMQEACELEPTSLATNIALGAICYYGRKYDESIKYTKVGLEIEPRNPIGLFNLGIAFEQKGMYEEALSEFQRIREFDPSNLLWLEGTAHVYSMRGQTKEVQRILRELEDPTNRKRVSPMILASIYAGLKDRDSAFRWLEQAAADHSLMSLELQFDPHLEVLKSDPRFGEFLRRYKLTSTS